MAHRRRPSSAFTLIELLVVIAIVAVLTAVLLPVLSRARQQAAAAICLSNLRECMQAARLYANEHGGWGPALGQPYSRLPNWAFVALKAAGRDARDPSGAYDRRSVLVCPAAQARYGGRMERTYAINATGHAGRPGDPDHYDDANRWAHVHYDRLPAPAREIVFLDSARLPSAPGLPPATRTSSVLDFRDPAHVRERIGRVHPPRGSGVQAAHADGSARRADTAVWQPTE